eukprot:3562574-Prymnesium_polylepis.1
MPAPFLACTVSAAGSYGRAEFTAALSTSQWAALRIGCRLLVAVPAYHWDGPEVLTAPSTP